MSVKSQQQIAESTIAPGQYEWAAVEVTVVSRTPRQVTIRFTKPFHGINAEYQIGKTITIPSEHFREV